MSDHRAQQVNGCRLVERVCLRPSKRTCRFDGEPHRALVVAFLEVGAQLTWRAVVDRTRLEERFYAGDWARPESRRDEAAVPGEMGLLVLRCVGGDGEEAA